jgi:hypothetical protein
MLEKFQVMCRLNMDGSDKILIPCLLPDRMPEETLFSRHWPEFENIPQVCCNSIIIMLLLFIVIIYYYAVLLLF